MSGFTLQLLLAGGLALALLWTLLGGPGYSGARVHELWQQRARFLLPFVLAYVALLMIAHWLL